MSKIFFSYSHEDREWVSSWLLPKLEDTGIEVRIDYRDFIIGRSSLINMEEAVAWCDKILLILTPNWVNSEWANFEALMEQSEDPMGLKGRLLPLMLVECNPPRRLGILTYADFKDEVNWETELSRLLAQLGVSTGVTVSKKGKTFSKPKKIFISKLPTTGAKLFGREEELKILDEAWKDEYTHVVTLVAWGGVGKTALVNHWLKLMGRDNFRGATKVYGWSFYSRTLPEGKQASADEFMQETLKWFGDKDPEEGSAVDKGRRLADLIRKEKTLLILDGIEPLQYPPGEVQELDGQLKDQGLKILLKELASSQPGLCVISSRESVTDLSGWIDFSMRKISLEHLSDAAGVQLLKHFGITGSYKDILDAVRDYGGHALALTLLGKYLSIVYDGDIKRRHLIPGLTEDESQGGHARRVMESYERWIGDIPQLDILYMMGIFDRPAPGGAIAALRKAPAIEGITSKLQDLSLAGWKSALKHLRDLGLLAQQNPAHPDTLNCHPLIRQYFSQTLKNKNPNGWKIAHKRLYHYYKNLPKKPLPDTLQEMEPLYTAVAHGCQAGLYKEALLDVYWERIKRKEQYYSTKKLGAFGADLAALSHFFQVPWSQPVSALSDYNKAIVLSWAAGNLQAVGRLKEAIQPMQTGLETYIEKKEWLSAAITAENLSILTLTLGWVKPAVEHAQQSVSYADRSRDDFQKITSRSTLANALHQFGDLRGARKWFQKAELLQQRMLPEFLFLYGLPGFQFCDLLLEQGAYREVLEWGAQPLLRKLQKDNLLSAALEKLSLGRACMMQILAEENGDISRIGDFLNQAVEGLRKAGTQHMLPLALLARTEFYRWKEEFSKAWNDLKETQEIAELGSMKLYLVDYHLEAGRLCLEEGKKKEACDHFDNAKKMVDEMGYYRRNKEVSQGIEKCK